MTANAIVRARIEEHIKDDATALLHEMGLTMSEAIRLLLVGIVRDRQFPFTPNAKTRAAMLESQNGQALPSFNTVEALMADLHEDD